MSCNISYCFTWCCHQGCPYTPHIIAATNFAVFSFFLFIVQDKICLFAKESICPMVMMIKDIIMYSLSMHINKNMKINLFIVVIIMD